MFALNYDQSGMKEMDIEQRKYALTHKTFLMMFHILWVVGIPAVGAYFGGRWLDTTYDMRPYGSVIASVIALVISWSILIRMYKKITSEYRALRIEEEKLYAAASQKKADDEDAS